MGSQGIVSSKMNAQGDNSLRRSDAELAAMFAPEPLRAGLLGLVRWHDEIAGLPLKMSEPMIGAMRIAWHRDAAEALFGDPPAVRRNPVVEGLAAAIALPGGPAREEIEALIDAHGADFEGRRFETLADFVAHADLTEGAVMRIAGRMLKSGGVLEAGEEETLTEAGRLRGLTLLVQAFPIRAGRGMAALPEKTMREAGLNEARVATGREPERARAALEPVLEEARAALRRLRGRSREVGPALFPACGHAALCAGDLKRLARSPDPYRPEAPPPAVLRQVRLIWASLSGKF